MSRWRLRGFVQDSDEEEEEFDSLSTNSSEPSQRAELGRVASPDQPFTPHAGETTVNVDNVSAASPSLRDGTGSGLEPAHPSLAVESTPIVRPTLPVDSPDPLQHSPPSDARRNANPPTYEPAGSQRPFESQDPLLRDIFETYAESDSPLSDPPSDDDEGTNDCSNSLVPQQRQRVQVVIPPQELLETSVRASRALRTRKPIQLHPYLLEYERYRQECQRRGIKPLPRPKSPTRPKQNDAETQEQAFSPENESPSNSPPLPASTAPVGHIRRHSRRTGNLELPSVGKSARMAKTPSGLEPVRFPRTQADPHYAIGRKKRKLNPPQSRAVIDIFEFPQSPPESSSPPPARNRRELEPEPLAITESVATLSNLPTPSNSSITDILPSVPISDSDEDVQPSAKRSNRFRPLVLSSEDSQPNSGVSDGGSESEAEVRQISKRIKGVLPASWLRLDQKAQQKRKELARSRSRTAFSPDRADISRGIAQRTVRPSKNSRNQSTPPDIDVIDTSDQSETNGPTHPYNNADDVHETAREASELATLLDSHYGDDNDDDLNSMENDRLHLFTLGGTGRKRKAHQLKLTDPFYKQKRSRTSGIGIADSKSSRASKGGVSKPKEPQYGARPGRIKNAGPALSIIDGVHAFPSEHAVPQFIKLALRRASRRPDQGRGNPSKKYIQLRTSGETEEANRTLQQWRSGCIKPKTQPTPPNGYRQPLKNRSTNQRLPPPEVSPTKDVVAERHADRSPIAPPGFGRQQAPRRKFAFKKASSASVVSAATTENGSRSSRKGPRKSRPPAPIFRAAQLEGLESDYGKSSRNIRFERGLQRANNEFARAPPRWEPSINPQLARFLAEDDALVPPPTISKQDSAYGHNSTHQTDAKAGRRGRRKPVAHRVDVDTREYRQPVEPPPAELIDNAPASDDAGPTHMKLEGLGSYGTVYSSTFDISPLAIGTYFSSETFIGSGSLSDALRTTCRDMDTPSGHCEFGDGSEHILCGPWNDETAARISSRFDSVWRPLHEQASINVASSETKLEMVLSVSRLLKSLIRYFSTTLSFLDAIDRQEFAMTMKNVLEIQFNRLAEVHACLASSGNQAADDDMRIIRPMAYVLVLCAQIHSITQNSVVEPHIRAEVSQLISSISKAIVQYIVSKGIPNLACFLERNKIYKEREAGIQEKEAMVECLVICMHTLSRVSIPGSGFWDLFSHQLSLLVANTTQVKKLESVWVTAFTILPFVEIDASGVLISNRRATLVNENWTFIKDLLNRIFQLYPGSKHERSSSANEYVRASLRRCHVLIETWHWKRCGPMLIAAFDFFGKNGLRKLQHEDCRNSPRFLEQLDATSHLDLEPADTAFQIFLKCLGAGLLGMRKSGVEEKKIRSIVFRCTPNHGRSYPKDHSLDQENLDALRNHHDLLCTLYWASPASCRPKLSLLRGLVQHESSHREACRLNVRAWTNLTMFQLSVEEPYTYLQPFAAWHKEIMHQTLKQYRLAKSEAENYLKDMQQEGDSDISTHMARRTMNKNQEQVIATLRDCVAGMKRAMKKSKNQACLKDFLIDSGVIELLELVNVDDSRLAEVIRDTLSLFREYITLLHFPTSEEFSQPRSEESQDYGDFPDFDDLADVEQQHPLQPPMEFIQRPLWHLLSNIFGAERAPDDNLLMESVDTWVQVASRQVSSGSRSWSYYIESFSPMSWHQLRDTEQTRRLKPYFMAALYMTSPSAFHEHQLDFISTLLVSLVDRESKLRYQDRLLRCMIHSDFRHPLLRDLPFYRDNRTGENDVTIDTVRERRLSLLSAVLANMQIDYHNAKLQRPEQATHVKQDYTVMLNNLMMAMKNNYQELHQSVKVAGAYVAFVQAVVQFLNQYTSDICPVNPFFTDSAEFPLPAADPTYVTGRLCGYAPKLRNPGVTKQLSTFVQTVAQQAAKDNHGDYLDRQFTSALTNDGDRTIDKPLLRSVLLQGIIPAYIEAALSGLIGFTIARPILQSLKGILGTLFFDIKVTDTSNVENACSNIFGILYTFARSTQELEQSLEVLHQPHVLRSITLVLDAVVQALPILEYILARTSPFPPSKPGVLTYISDFTVFLAEVLHQKVPYPVASFDATNDIINGQYSSLLPFCKRMLKSTMENNWAETPEGVAFGHGSARTHVLVDIGTVEEETWRVIRSIELFHAAVENVFGHVHVDNWEERSELELDARSKGVVDALFI